MFLLCWPPIEDIEFYIKRHNIHGMSFVLISLKKIREKKVPSFNRMRSTKHFKLNLIVYNCGAVILMKSTQRRYRIKRRKIHIWPYIPLFLH